MGRFDTHIINITLEEAITAFNNTNCFFFDEARKYYEGLVAHYQAAFPNRSLHDQQVYALATLWTAGHLQGVYERETYEKRVCGEVELKEAV